MKKLYRYELEYSDEYGGTEIGLREFLVLLFGNNEAYTKMVLSGL